MQDAIRVNRESGLVCTSLRTPFVNAGQWTEYPRPGMVRSCWYNLNGAWQYAITKENASCPQMMDGDILVPFSPEAPLSDVQRQLLPGECLWYRLSLPLLDFQGDERVLLHFGAVDQYCRVFLNGQLITEHEGGYLPFEAEITDAYRMSAVPTLTVAVTDGTDTNPHSRGKQRLKRGGMYYTAQSGIWQTVWLEVIPKDAIRSVRILPDYDKACCRVVVEQDGSYPIQCIVSEETPEMTLWRDHPEAIPLPESKALYQATGEIAECTIPMPGFRPWTPDDPFLYRLTVRCGEDAVECLFGMRCLTVENGSLCLNHTRCMQVGVLDQGYWPDGLYTAPCDEALVYDIRTMKGLGFNMLRKHIKIEPERWYYHCDRLGMLVWQDMVNGGGKVRDWLVTYLGTVLNIHHVHLPDTGIFRRLLSRDDRYGRIVFLCEVKATIRLLENHPSVVAWVPFNEGWGQFDAKAVAELVRTWDPTRWIDHASGWFDQGAGDVISLHHYFFKLHIPKKEQRRVLAMTEFGGETLPVQGHTFSDRLYGYGRNDSPEALNKAYEAQWQRMAELARKGFCAFIYTQLSDVEDELNGLLTYDRAVIKIDFERSRTVLAQVLQTKPEK